MLGRILHSAAFQKAWLGASAILGSLAVLAGALEAVRGKPESVVGFVSGAVLLLVSFIGLRNIKRKSLHGT